jgi:hypothetical protein
VEQKSRELVISIILILSGVGIILAIRNILIDISGVLLISGGLIIPDYTKQRLLEFLKILSKAGEENTPFKKVSTVTNVKIGKVIGRDDNSEVKIDKVVGKNDNSINKGKFHAERDINFYYDKNGKGKNTRK